MLKYFFITSFLLLTIVNSYSQGIDLSTNFLEFQKADSLIQQNKQEEAIGFLKSLINKEFEESNAPIYHKIQSIFGSELVSEYDSAIYYLNREIALLKSDDLLFNRYQTLANYNLKIDILILLTILFYS